MQNPALDFLAAQQPLMAYPQLEQHNATRFLDLSSSSSIPIMRLCDPGLFRAQYRFNSSGTFVREDTSRHHAAQLSTASEAVSLFHLSGAAFADDRCRASGESVSCAVKCRRKRNGQRLGASHLPPSLVLSRSRR